MAEDETRTHILQSLNDQRLGATVPARRDVREEPTEPVEPSDTGVTERGRAPEDVVPAREPTAPAVPEKKEAAPATEKKYKIKGEELTLKQITERGLLDSLIITAEQFPALQQKYQERLEREASREVVPAKPAEPETPPPTQKQIRDTFLPMLQKAVEAGYIEADFAEAYPDVATNLMWYRDIITDTVQKLGLVLQWIQAEAQKRNAVMVQTLLDRSIDAVANRVDTDGKPVKVFDFLKNPEHRKTFIEWLSKEVDPKVAALTPENMEKFALAFIGNDLLKFTNEMADKVKTPPRPKARSDGSSSRPGTPETPQPETLIDRLSSLRLGPQS